MSESSLAESSSIDFFKNFVFDIYVLLTKNINPFSWEWEIQEGKGNKMILLLWGESVPTNFYKHICKNENFFSLREKNVFHPKASETVWKFIEENRQDYRLSDIILLIKYCKSFQYVYSKDCLDIYSSTENREFNRKRKANLKLSLINGKIKLK